MSRNGTGHASPLPAAPVSMAPGPTGATAAALVVYRYLGVDRWTGLLDVSVEASAG